jgi:hypothetical protein
MRYYIVSLPEFRNTDYTVRKKANNYTLKINILGTLTRKVTKYYVVQEEPQLRFVFGVAEGKVSENMVCLERQFLASSLVPPLKATCSVG